MTTSDTTTSDQDEDWGGATLYAGGRPIEPPTVGGGDPFNTLFFEIPETADDADDEADVQWGTTTYVGRPRRRDARHAAEPGTVDVAEPPVAEPVAPGTESSLVLDTGLAEPVTGEAEDAEHSNRRLLAASGSMAVASLTSRLTGFVRTALLLAALGTGAVGNAYNAGNNFPNQIYELLLGGVLSSVLIPLLVHAQSQDADEGVAYIQRLLSIATAALGAMTLLAVLAAPLVASAFVPAGSQRELTTVFATLLLPEIFFYGLGAMFMALLNVRHSYKPGAWAPVLNNVIMIVTVAVFWALPGPVSLNPSTITNAQILVVGIGTTLGIAAQALVLVPSLRRVGFRWQWRFRARPNEAGRLREVGTLTGWVLAYVLVSQVGVTVIQYVGVHNGGFTVFTNADLLFQMPYGILVVSLLTAIMPRLSRAAVRGDHDAVKRDLSLGSRLSAVALLPVTAGLIALAPVLAVTIFAYGEVTIAHAHLIGASLAWSAFGLLPFAIVMLQLRVFYAMRDGKTPTLINAFMVATKVVLVFVTDHAFAAPAGTNVNVHPSTAAVEWLNISTSLSYVVGAIVGQIVLTRRLGHLDVRRLLRTAIPVALASAVGGAVAYAVVVGFRHVLGAARFGSATGLVVGGIAGLAVFVALVWRMRIEDVRGVVATVRRE